MAHRFYTFADMAARICELDGRTDVAAVKEQIRGFHQRGLLLAVDHGGPRGAVRVAAIEFCRARLLLALLDLGVQGDELERANGAITNGGRRTFPDGGVINRTLVELVSAKPDEAWILKGGVYADESGSHFSAKLVRDFEANRPYSSADNPEGDTTLPGSDPSQRLVRVLAHVKIPASDLIANLVEA